MISCAQFSETNCERCGLAQYCSALQFLRLMSMLRHRAAAAELQQCGEEEENQNNNNNNVNAANNATNAAVVIPPRLARLVRGDYMSILLTAEFCAEHDANLERLEQVAAVGAETRSSITGFRIDERVSVSDDHPLGVTVSVMCLRLEHQLALAFRGSSLPDLPGWAPRGGDGSPPRVLADFCEMEYIDCGVDDEEGGAVVMSIQCNPGTPHAVKRQLLQQQQLSPEAQKARAVQAEQRQRGGLLPLLDVSFLPMMLRKIVFLARFGVPREVDLLSLHRLRHLREIQLLSCHVAIGDVVLSTDLSEGGFLPPALVLLCFCDIDFRATIGAAGLPRSMTFLQLSHSRHGGGGYALHEPSLVREMRQSKSQHVPGTIFV